MNLITNPDVILDGIRRVAPRLSASVGESEATDALFLRLEYRERVEARISYYQPAEVIEETVIETVRAFQRKAVEDLGIDTEALKRIEELEGEVAEGLKRLAEAEERVIAANARLDAVLALVGKGTAS